MSNNYDEFYELGNYDEATFFNKVIKLGEEGDERSIELLIKLLQRPGLGMSYHKQVANVLVRFDQLAHDSLIKALKLNDSSFYTITAILAISDSEGIKSLLEQILPIDDEKQMRGWTAFVSYYFGNNIWNTNACINKIIKDKSVITYIY
jgi:hypothetical protein